MAVDFISLGNIIFKDKHNYKYVANEDKEKNFFILNRKFAYRDIKKAKFFNDKNIDKASALDMWYKIFTNTTNVPPWYWKTKINKSKKEKSPIKKEDSEELKERFDLSDFDLQFLNRYYIEEVKYNIKQMRKYKKKDKITNAKRR